MTVRSAAGAGVAVTVNSAAVPSVTAEPPVIVTTEGAAGARLPSTRWSVSRASPAWARVASSRLPTERMVPLLRASEFSVTATPSSALSAATTSYSNTRFLAPLPLT